MRIHQTAIVFVCALLAGCGSITTKYPIGTTTGLPRDEALVGTWIPRDEKTGNIARTEASKVAVYIHVVPVKSGALDIITVQFPVKSDDPGELSLYRATTSRLGENRYLNITPLPEPGETYEKPPIAGTIPYLYRFEPNGDLVAFRLTEDKVIAAIQSGALAGTITERVYRSEGKEYGRYKDIEITAEPTALDAFMARPEAATLFEVMGRLKRSE